MAPINRDLLDYIGIIFREHKVGYMKQVRFVHSWWQESGDVPTSMTTAWNSVLIS